MKKMNLVFAVLFIAGAAFAGGNTDYSGKYTLNEGESQFGNPSFRMAPVEMIVKTHKDSLEINRSYRVPNGEIMNFDEKVALDGSESKSSWRNSTRASTLAWSEDGKTMKIQSSVVFEGNNGQGEATSVEEWNLSEDGKTLTIRVSVSSTWGEVQNVLVFDKE